MKRTAKRDQPGLVANSKRAVTDSAQERPNYVDITEFPGALASSFQTSIMMTRYKWARDYSPAQVLEIGCGSGIGLGYLAASSEYVVGGDIEQESLATAAAGRRGQKFALCRLSAQSLPFRQHSFQAAVCFEMIYYLDDLDAFMSEVNRVLAMDGKLLISVVNPEWGGWIPSPYATSYPTCAALKELGEKNGFEVSLLGLPDEVNLRNRALYAARRLASQLGLIPRTLQDRSRLKRLFYGQSQALPDTLYDGFAEVMPLVPVDMVPLRFCPFLFVECTKLQLPV